MKVDRLFRGHFLESLNYHNISRLSLRQHIIETWANMTSLTASTKPPNGDRSHPTTEQSLAEKFVNIIHQFSGNDGYLSLSAFVDETQKLRAENRRLENELREMKVTERRNFALIKQVGSENDQKTQQLGKSQAERTEAVRLRKLAEAKVVSVTEQLESTMTEITNTMNTKKNLDDRITGLTQDNEINRDRLEKSNIDLETAQKELAEVRKQHTQDSQELVNLRSKAFPLKKLGKTDKEALSVYYSILSALTCSNAD